MTELQGPVGHHAEEGDALGAEYQFRCCYRVDKDEQRYERCSKEGRVD